MGWIKYLLVGLDFFQLAKSLHFGITYLRSWSNGNMEWKTKLVVKNLANSKLNFTFSINLLAKMDESAQLYSDDTKSFWFYCASALLFCKYVKYISMKILEILQPYIEWGNFQLNYKFLTKNFSLLIRKQERWFDKFKRKLSFTWCGYTIPNHCFYSSH